MASIHIKDWIKHLACELPFINTKSKILNLEICSTEDEWVPYFKAAEGDMDGQWENIIWPLLHDMDFSSVLELAPGAGRNTVKLAEHADVIHAVDLNEYVLQELRERFTQYHGKCDVRIYKNDGTKLDMIPSRSITLVYSWDAVVHFDRAVIYDYIKEFSRVLVKGGRGFIHHSNLGLDANPDIRENPHWRSRMSKELFKTYCKRSGLTVLKQIDMPWAEITDCLSIFQK